MSKSPWLLVQQNPPAKIRLLARRKTNGKNVRPLTLQEIAIASGLPLARVEAISWATSWDNITVREAERYIAGCNWDPLSAADRNRQFAYERACKNNPFHYLKSSPLWAQECLPRIRALKARAFRGFSRTA